MEKGSTGQVVTPTAETWNAMVDSAKWYSRQVKLGWPGAQHRPRLTGDFVTVKNVSGGQRSAGDVLEIGTLAVGSVRQAEPLFEADTFASGGTRLCVLREDLPDDTFGLAQVSGVCVATVDIQNTSHEYARPTNASNVLESDDAGPVLILYAPASTGEQDCFVLLSAAAVTFQPLIAFTLSAALATSDASQSATIDAQYGPGVPNDASSVTVHNMDISGSGYLFAGDSGDKGLAQWDMGNNYRIIQMECP